MTQSCETRLTVMVFRGGQNLPLYAAQEMGFLARRGLSVELLFAPSADALLPGLASGRLQIVHSTADNAVKLADVDGLDVALVVGGDNAHNHLIAQADVASLADLRGRTVLVDTATSGYAHALFEILARHGLGRGDYEVRTVGATPRRLAALLSDRTGKLAVLNPPFSIQAVRAGLKDMGTVVGLMGRYQGPAGYVRRSWASGNAETLVRYLKAYIEGVRWTRDPANRARAVALLAGRLELDADIAAAVYAEVADPVDGFAADGAFDLEGFRNVLRLRAEQLGRAPPRPETYLDLSHYERALAELSHEALA